jgi:hypothetical protein
MSFTCQLFAASISAKGLALRKSKSRYLSFFMLEPFADVVSAKSCYAFFPS